MKTKVIAFHFVIVCFIACFSSCASIFKKSYTPLTVYSADSIYIHPDETQIIDARRVGNHAMHLINAKRKRKPLTLTVSNATDTAQITIPSKIEDVFWLNLATYGVGVAVDLVTQKMYTYPTQMYINENLKVEQLVKVKKDYTAAYNKGHLYLTLGFPTVNHFVRNYDILGKEMHASKTGAFGISGGLEYYYKDKRYLSATLGIATGSTFDYIGYHRDSYYVAREEDIKHDDSMTIIESSYISVMNNHVVKQFHFGYGLSIANDYIKKRHFRVSDIRYSDTDGYYYYQEEAACSKNIQVALGGMFKVHWMPTPAFYVGINYRPTIWQVSEKSNFKYEHLISLDFGFKIRLTKKKTNK